MPPRRGESIERTDEYDELIEKLREFHEKRETHFDPEPKVGVRHIDLLQLYTRVVGEGGYDLVSDTKAKPLMWRRMAEEFIGKNQYTPAQAFQLKNVYYKNLCAYEISTHWGKEPPPKEILEEVTAKGGAVMGRTLENFTPPAKREQVNLASDNAEEGTPEQKTPGKMDVDEDPGSATGSRTRGLRQQPPQRVLFQPDLAAGRQTRGGLAAQSGSPAPVGPASGANGIMNAASLANHGASSTLASYEPQQSYPLSLRPVTTPANNPEVYRLERKRKLEDGASALAKKFKNIMLPGTGFVGPNIYVRAQLALQSGLPEEESYALHHLTKISHERGDKYRFDQFPGLADALLKKAIEVSGLFYDVDFDVSYHDEDEPPFGPDGEVLDGLQGTSNVIEKLRSRIPLLTSASASLQDTDSSDKLSRCTEAALILRNMTMLDENARYLSTLPLTRDYLTIALDLPQHPSIVELQQHALDTAEQVLRHVDIGAHDALYYALMNPLERAQDRGAIIVALRTIARIGERLPQPKQLEEIPNEILQNVADWLLVDDEELRSACLDFLTQYTSFAANVEDLIDVIDVESLARQLSRLLFFSARSQKQDQRPPTRSDRDDGDGTHFTIPRLSRSIVQDLLKLGEPERSSEWLRMCFLADPASEMTQISLWQAYQATFAQFHNTHPHLIAGDFIKNVSSTFPGATAQVAGSNKYVIRGIKPRKVPVDISSTAGLSGAARLVTEKTHKELYRCCWKLAVPPPENRDPLAGMHALIPPTPQERECGDWFRSGDDILKHILTSHLQLPPKRAGSEDDDKMEVDSSRPASSASFVNGTTAVTTLASVFDFKKADSVSYRCKWANCQRKSDDFTSGKAPKTALFTRHIMTHLPTVSPLSSKNNLKPEDSLNVGTDQHTTTYITTLQDEKNDAAGLPLGAALVLRNIAKFMRPKSIPADATTGAPAPDLAPSESDEEDEVKKGISKEGVFGSEVKERLFEALAKNRVIREYVGQVLKAVG